MDRFINVKDKIIIKESEIVAIRQKGEDVVISTSGDDFLIVKTSLEEFNDVLNRENIDRDHEWENRIKILIKVYENKIERSRNRAEYCDKKECEEAILEGKLSYFQIKTYEIMIEDLKGIIDGVL